MLRRVSAFCWLALTTALSQTVTFTSSPYPSQGVLAAQADLNGDGILDVVSLGLNSVGKTGFYVTLSKPDGSYGPPVFYTTPSQGGSVSVALGDFNRDGKVDVAEVEGTAGYYIFLNQGDGTLLPSSNFATPSGSVNFRVATADFNSDGKLDLIVFNSGNLQLLYGNGYGTFSPPYTFATDPNVDQIFVGDFDSDGKADVATTWTNCGCVGGCRTHIRVYYGDGKGDFSTPATVDYSEPYTFSSDNVKEDAFSDLFGVSGSSLRILHGNSDRTFTEQDVSLLADASSIPVAADLNGDGIKDLALIEGSDVVVLLGKSDGSYQAEQTVYSASGLQSLLAGRYNPDTKPDLLASKITDPSNLAGVFELLLNATTGTFPSCPPPGASSGIALCSPASGASVVSPVKLAVGAASTSALRKTEVWIDGVKVQESFNSYASYSFLDGSLNLAAGSHRADVYAAGYDNRLQLRTIYFNVGTASLQYDVSLFPWKSASSTPAPTGQVTVDSAGVTTVQLSQAPGDTTYTVEFCPAPEQNYPNCSTVGSVTTNASGATSRTISFPAGSWAGDFQLVRNGAVEYSTSVIAGVPSVYYATLQPNSTVNGKGTWIFPGSPPPPQDPLQTGSVSLNSTGLLYVSLTGAAPNAVYEASQCPLVDGSDCYGVETLGQSFAFTTDKNGDATYTAGLGTDIPEDIFSVGQTYNQGIGFTAGFRVP